ncbi:MAG: hypothetical protein KM310_00500 [Clostridiales bacterium]|nr:hypothetical protein [Clostridiales bacterium]
MERHASIEAVYSLDLEEQIRAALKKVEHRKRAGRIEAGALETAFHFLRLTPYGTVYLDGRAHGPMTRVHIAWATHRGKKRVVCRIWRSSHRDAPYDLWRRLGFDRRHWAVKEPASFLSLSRYPAYPTVFPKRAYDLNTRLLSRILRRVGISKADRAFAIFVHALDLNHFRVVESSSRDRLALVQNDVYFYVIAPLGIFSLGYSKQAKSIDEALSFFRLRRDDVTRKDAFIARAMGSWWGGGFHRAEYLIPSPRKDPFALTRFAETVSVPPEILSLINHHPRGGIAGYVEHHRYKVMGWASGEDKLKIVTDISDLPYIISTPGTPTGLLFSGDRKALWRVLYPKRYARWKDRRILKILREHGIVAPDLDGLHITDVEAFWPKAKLALVRLGRSLRYLLSPTEPQYLQPRQGIPHGDIGAAFESAFGIPLPEDPSLDWEDVRVLIAMATLAKA